MQRDRISKISVTSPLNLIPIDRLPIEKYRDLKQRKFFRWAILNLPQYLTKLLAVWIAIFLLSALIVGAKTTSDRLDFSDFIVGAIAGKIAVLFCLTVLYGKWYDLYLRLVSKRIIYLVSSSSEKNVWYKSETMLSRDLLVARFQVLPFLQRIVRTAIVLIFSLFGFLVLFLFY